MGRFRLAQLRQIEQMKADLPLEALCEGLPHAVLEIIRSPPTPFIPPPFTPSSLTPAPHPRPSPPPLPPSCSHPRPGLGLEPSVTLGQRLASRGLHRSRPKDCYLNRSVYYLNRTGVAPRTRRLVKGLILSVG